MEGKNSLINLEQLVFGIVRTVPECVVYCTVLYYCTVLLYYTAVLYCCTILYYTVSSRLPLSIQSYRMVGGSCFKG